MNERRDLREINQPRKKTRAEYQRQKAEQEAEKERVRQQFLTAVKEFYNREITANPGFRLSLRILDTYIQQHPEKFPGITRINSLLKYFNGSLASLEIALGILTIYE